jgi:hypothetical protein
MDDLLKLTVWWSGGLVVWWWCQEIRPRHAILEEVYHSLREIMWDEYVDEMIRNDEKHRVEYLSVVTK